MNVSQTTAVCKVGPLWFPSAGWVEWSSDTGAGMTVLGRKVVKLESVRTENIPDSLFVPTLPPGAHLSDTDTNTKYIIGPGGRRIEVPRKTQMGAWWDISQMAMGAMGSLRLERGEL